MKKAFIPLVCMFQNLIGMLGSLDLDPGTELVLYVSKPYRYARKIPTELVLY